MKKIYELYVCPICGDETLHISNDNKKIYSCLNHNHKFKKPLKIKVKRL